MINFIFILSLCFAEEKGRIDSSGKGMGLSLFTRAKSTGLHCGKNRREAGEPA